MKFRGIAIEDRRAVKKAIRSNFSIVCEKYAENRTGTPADTIAEIVDAIGYDSAVVTIAEIVNTVGTWDGRVSADSRAWAESIENAADADSLRDAGIYQPNAIHPAHINQLAEAMAEYTPAEVEETPEAVAMVTVDELESGLNLGDYGEYLNDYRDSSSYICDAITEIADNNTSIYHSDIMAFLSRNPEAVEDAIREFGWDGCGGTLEKAAQMGEFLTIERDLYDHMADAVMLAAVHFVRYDLKIEEIPEELADLIRQWADEADNNDRMDEIPDKIREYLFPEEDEDE